jgi:type IV pilus assembly protein PilP
MTKIGLILLFLVMSGCSGEISQEQIVLPPTTQVDTNTERKDSAAGDQTLPSTGADLVTPSAVEYAYDPSGRRDPFRSLLLVSNKAKGGTPLQQRALSEIRLVGIVWEANEYTAMVETPDGKGYTIRAGTPVGPGGGKVKKITERTVIIEEYFSDFAGGRKAKETVIGLPTKEEELE